MRSVTNFGRIGCLSIVGLICFLNSTIAHAGVALSEKPFPQEQGIVRGVVLESGTSHRVSQVNVTNVRTRRAVATDSRGEFALEVRVGDSLVFSKLGYEETHIEIRTLSDILIDIRPSTVLLETVTVQRKRREDELREVLGDYRRQGVYSEGKPSVLGYVFQPITSIYERFSRSGRQARRFRNFLESESQALVVDRIFATHRISALTGLTDADLLNFSQIYRPTYAEVQYWNEYDVTHYILESFREFDAAGRPESQKLPRIPIPPQQK